MNENNLKVSILNVKGVDTPLIQSLKKADAWSMGVVLGYLALLD